MYERHVRGIIKFLVCHEVDIFSSLLKPSVRRNEAKKICLYNLHTFCLYMRTDFRRWFLYPVCFYKRYSWLKHVLITGIKYKGYMATVFRYTFLISGMFL